jgi:hypothetical protein
MERVKEGLELLRGLAEGYIRISQPYSILGSSEVRTGKQDGRWRWCDEWLCDVIGGLA